MFLEAIKKQRTLINFTEGFSIIPKNSEDIEDIGMNFLGKEILQYYIKNFKKFSNFPFQEILPLSIEENEKIKKSVKFNFGGNKDKLKQFGEIISKTKEFKNKVKVKYNKSSITFLNSENNEIVLKCKLGAGTRNKKAGGGKAGIGFERDIEKDLVNYSLGERDNFTHPNFVEKIVEKVKEIYKIDLSKKNFKCERLGGKNQNRNIKFDGKKFTATPNGDIGKILTDIDIIVGKTRIHLSLKFTSQFYLTNFSIREFLKTPGNDAKRDNVLYYLGFNPKLWCDGYSGIWQSNMDKTPTDKEIIKNLEQLLKEVVGYGYVYIIGGGKVDVVEYIGKKNTIKILSVIDVGYANANRKYSFVKFQLQIGNTRYKASMQNRGTTSNDGPNYIRLLLMQ